MRVVIFFILLSMSFVTFCGCAGNKKLGHPNQIEKINGYYIEKFIYRYDSVGLVSGYWQNEKKIITNNVELPLANYLSDFYKVFKCQNFSNLEEYLRNTKTITLSSLLKDPNEYYFLDNDNRDLYFIGFVTGDFIHLKKALCSKDENSLKNMRVKKICTYDTNKIRGYPFLIPVTYYNVTTVEMKDIQRIIGVKNIQRVKIDTLYFPVCM